MPFDLKVIVPSLYVTVTLGAHLACCKPLFVDGLVELAVAAVIAPVDIEKVMSAMNNPEAGGRSRQFIRMSAYQFAILPLR